MRVFTEGYESGDFGNQQTVSASTNYTNAVAAAAARSGVYGYRVSRAVGFSGAGCYVESTYDANSTQVNQYADPAGLGYARPYINGAHQWFHDRRYWRLNTAPTSWGNGFYLIRSLNAAASQQASLIQGASGLVAAITGGANTAFFTPSAATWYRIEREVRQTGTGVGFYEVRIYVGDSLTLTASLALPFSTGAAMSLERTRVGMMPVIGAAPFHGTGAAEWDFDDEGINDFQTKNNNYWLGPGAVTLYQPNADGSPLQFDTTGANHFGEVDDAVPWPPDTTTYIGPSAVTTEEIDNLDFPSYGGASTIRAAQVLVYYRNEDHTVALGTGHHAGIIDSGGVKQYKSGALPLSNDSNYRYASISVSGTGPNGDTPWTNAEFNHADTEIILQRDATLDGNQRLRFSGVLIQADDGTPPSTGSLAIPRPILTHRAR